MWFLPKSIGLYIEYKAIISSIQQLKKKNEAEEFKGTIWLTYQNSTRWPPQVIFCHSIEVFRRDEPAPSIWMMIVHGPRRIKRPRKGLFTSKGAPGGPILSRAICQGNVSRRRTFCRQRWSRATPRCLLPHLSATSSSLLSDQHHRFSSNSRHLVEHPVLLQAHHRSPLHLLHHPRLYSHDWIFNREGVKKLRFYFQK